MDALAAFVRFVDRVNDVIGRGIAWLNLAMILTTFAVVVLRYGLAVGWVGLQESYVWMYGIVFMVDLCGVLFLLLPMIAVATYVSVPYVLASWAHWEGSREAGGLEGLFLLKTVLLVFCLLVALQGLSMAARAILVLAGHEEFLVPEDVEPLP